MKTTDLGETRYVGAIPVRTELTVPTNPPPDIGWTVTVYDGCEVYPAPIGYQLGDGSLSWTSQPEPITFKEGLQPGDLVLFWGWVGTVHQGDDGSMTVRTPSGTTGLLSWDKDDRHCWTCTGVISASAIKALMVRGNNDE